MSELRLIAATQMGMEGITGQELKNLGYKNTEIENGRAIFYGSERDVLRTNLWLRTADRIRIELGQFEAHTFDDLFEGTKALDWSRFIPWNGAFPVQGRSRDSQLSSVPACQSIVKKAVVEHLREQTGESILPEDGPLFSIEVSLQKNIATLTLDTTGASLHKRGYRKQAGQAPLKETMAAALVLLSRWEPDRPLYDPLCGSGTIPIEAALIGWNIAPGLRRSFSCQDWPSFQDADWKGVQEEAFDAVKDEQPLDIFGSDINPGAIDLAKQAAKKAGLAYAIKFHPLSLMQAHPNGKYGCLITNPPYGERIGDYKEIRTLTRQLGSLSKQLPDWSFFVLSPDERFEERFGQAASKKRKLYNGRIECQYYQFFGPLPSDRS